MRSVSINRLLCFALVVVLCLKRCCCCFFICEHRVADVDTIIVVVYVSTDFDAMLSYIPSKYYFLGQQNEQQADKWNRPAKVRTTFAFSVQKGLD